MNNQSNTTETPFTFNNDACIQIDSVLIGFPLALLFADFYTSTLENKILDNNNTDNSFFTFVT